MNCKYIGLVIVILVCQASLIHSECQQIDDRIGSISDSYEVFGSDIILRCWRIAFPAHHVINASIELPEFSNKENTYCDRAHVKLKPGDGGISISCNTEEQTDVMFFANNDTYLQLEFYVDSSKFSNKVIFSFHLKYFILLPFLNVKGIFEVRENAINWLKKKHSLSLGWKEDTPRAVTALYLSGAARYNGILFEEILAKHAELITALALTRNTTSIHTLISFINGLLVICFPPRQFYGYDLVDKLEKEMKESGKFTHPSAYLALCNANATWPVRSTIDLTRILSSESNYHFVKDIQALAIMALSCNYKRNNFSGEENEVKLKSLYLETIKRLQGYQHPDGSFGDLHTTALITQALIASDQELSTGWRIKDTFQYFIKELNSSEANFISIYATLPLLYGKTLIDIANMNCSNNPRTKETVPVYEIKSFQSPNKRVHFSLYIGDQKDVIHTISLNVPKNSTAYNVMELAAEHNNKYEFKAGTSGSVKYVYEIAGIPNNPEEGKFWLLYVKLRNAENALSESVLNPDELVLEDEDYFVMWYKTVHI